MNRVRVVSFVWMCSALVLAACGGDDKKLELGGACSLNSDCADGLLCKFGACHKACVKSVDCAAGERCVQVDGVAVCQMAACAPGCPAPLVCNVSDQTCRNTCSPSNYCLGGQVCTAGMCLEFGEADAGQSIDAGGADVAPTPDVAAAAPDVPVVAPDVPVARPDAPLGTLDATPAMDTTSAIDGASTGCGEITQACCATGTPCRLVTNTCSSGVCVECGQRDQPCCGQMCTLATVECNANKICSCGGANEKCCSGNLCSVAGLSCDTGRCSCGGQGQLCCPGTPKTCATETQCTGSRCTCIQAVDTCEVLHSTRLDSSILFLSRSGRVSVQGLDSSNVTTSTVMRDADNPLENIVAVAASAGCGMYGLDATGKIWQWGRSVTTISPKAVVVAQPVLASDGGPQLDGVTAIAAGGVYDGLSATCFLKGGGVLCMGSGELLGYGFTGPQWSYPVAVKVDASTPLTDVARLSVGGESACAVKLDGSLWCWGKGASFAQQSALFGGTKIKDVAVNSKSACVLLEDGSVRCWGSGTSGELGDGQSANSTTPVLVITSTGVPLQGITALSRRTASVYGGGLTCAVMTDSSLGLRAWVQGGSSDHG